MTDFDLDRYLARIGWTGPRHPSFETLAGVLRAHMKAIPFENLDVLLGRGVRIDLASVHAKLVTARRGGYCFEHGVLFRGALEGLGFEPEAHAARVIMQRPRAEAALTHMVLTVRLGGRAFVLDPGFGRHAPLVPVPLETGQQAADEGELHRMVKSGHDWVLEVRVDGAMLPLWSSSFEPAEPVDFVMGNHFVSTFPESPFVTGLRLHAFAPHGSVSMLNRDMTIRYAGGVEKSVIADRDALHALLAEHFGFDLPDVRRLRVPSVPEWT